MSSADPFEKLLLGIEVEPDELLREMAWPGTYMYMIRPGEDGVRYDTDDRQIYLQPNRIKKMQRRVEGEQDKSHTGMSLLPWGSSSVSERFHDYARRSRELMEHLEDEGYGIEAEYVPETDKDLGELTQYWEDKRLRL